jgi:chromosome segregation ATPase
MVVTPLGLLLGLFTPCLAATTAAASRENPIRKVVVLLQSLREEVEEEGRKEKDLFDKFACYCTDSTEKLTASIDSGRADIANYESTVKELSGSNAQLALEIKEVKEDLEENQKAIADATGVRTKEKEEFLAESSETANAISALDKAIPAIEKGTAPATALAQVNLGTNLLQHSPSMQDHVVLEGLLQAKTAVGDMENGVGSAQILGILQQMQDNFKEDLAASTKSEEEAEASYEDLKAAKEKQISALNSELREKETRVAEQKATLSETKENLEDATSALSADEDFLVQLKDNCKTKSEEFDANTVSRNAEIQGIGEAVKILNDDNALDLFKSTLPGQPEPPSFLQLRVVPPERVVAAARAMSRAAKGLPSKEFASVTFVQLQLQRAAQTPDQFGPVKKMITDMVMSLKKEQEDDNKQKDFCGQALPQAGNDKAGIQQGLDDQTRAMGEMKTEVTAVAQKITTMKEEIDELDAAVTKSTEQRKEENAFHTESMAELAMAMQLLNKAKSKLAAVYEHKEGEALLQTGDFRREEHGSDEDAAMGRMLGISFVQVEESSGNLLSDTIAALSGTEPPPPPETAAYSSKTSKGMGIMGLMSELVQDLKVEQQKASSEEAAAQKAYELSLADSQAAREATSKEVVAMQSQKAKLEEKLQETKASHRSLQGEMKAIVGKIASLHEECDFIVANYDLRKNARGQEVEAMQNAVAILSGANLGFAQGGRAF